MTTGESDAPVRPGGTEENEQTSRTLPLREDSRSVTVDGESLNEKCCSYTVGLLSADYSKWERKKQTNSSRSTTSKTVRWSSFHPDYKKTRASIQPITASHSETTESLNEVKQDQPEKPERSRGDTNKNSSAASSRLSRRAKTDNRLQESALGCARVNSRAETLKVLMKLQRRSVEDLEKHCEVLQETNQQVARDIEDTDRRGVSITRELLTQHRKLGSSITAITRWSNWQNRQAQAELKDAVQEAGNHLSDLQAQLHAVTAEVVKAQSELHTLKTYKDQEFPVKALQAAELERDLDKLKEAQQDEYEDVRLQCETEMARLERRLHQKQQEALSAIAKKNASHIPPGVKQTALHNQTMKNEIDEHKQEIMQLEEENRKLLKSIRELQLSRSDLSRGVFRDVFRKSDKCTPDMDVHLSIQREELLPI